MRTLALRAPALEQLVTSDLGFEMGTLYARGMPKSADALRRWFGLLFLAAAFGLLVWGQTVLRDRLAGVAFLIYWGLCFLCTMAAIVTALLDLRATRRAAQKDQEKLMERTLEEAGNEAERDRKSSDEL